MKKLNCNAPHLGAPKIDPEIIGAAVSSAANILGGLNTNKFDYPECGKRPLFTGKRRNAYDQCVAALIQSGRAAAPEQMPSAMPNFVTPGAQIQAPQVATRTAAPMNFLTKYKTPLLIGGAAIAAILIFKPFKK